MSWNEVKIGIAPIGSAVTVQTDGRAVDWSGEPVKIVGSAPPRRGTLPPHTEVAEWLESHGFALKRANPPYFTYTGEGMDILVATRDGSVVGLTANLRMESDFRQRVPERQNLIERLCQRFNLELVDADRGLVEASHLRRLVEESFAWRCLVEREKAQGGKQENESR